MSCVAGWASKLNSWLTQIDRREMYIHKGVRCGETPRISAETVNHRQWLFASLGLRAEGAEKQLLEAASRDDCVERKLRPLGKGLHQLMKMPLISGRFSSLARYNRKLAGKKAH